jgi:adenosine deaminase
VFSNEMFTVSMDRYCHFYAHAPTHAHKHTSTHSYTYKHGRTHTFTHTAHAQKERETLSVSDMRCSEGVKQVSFALKAGLFTYSFRAC